VSTETATSRGAEAFIDWYVAPLLRIQASATRFDMNAPNVRIAGMRVEGSDPKQSYSLRTHFDLPARTELDLRYRYVGSSPSVSVPAYDSVDLRLGWRPSGAWELSFDADNLFDRVHREFIDEEQGVIAGARIGRSVFFRASWNSSLLAPGGSR
jgi:iron complex outermembrane receptor protein